MSRRRVRLLAVPVSAAALLPLLSGCLSVSGDNTPIIAKTDAAARQYHECNKDAGYGTFAVTPGPAVLIGNVRAMLEVDEADGVQRSATLTLQIEPKVDANDTTKEVFVVSYLVRGSSGSSASWYEEAHEFVRMNGDELVHRIESQRLARSRKVEIEKIEICARFSDVISDPESIVPVVSQTA